MAEVTYRALRDVVSPGGAHKQGSTFTADEESVVQALAFGLVERVDEDDKPKSQAKRGTARKAT